MKVSSRKDAKVLREQKTNDVFLLGVFASLREACFSSATYA